MSTHNIGFYEDLTKIIFELSSNIIKFAPYFFCWRAFDFSCLDNLAGFQIQNFRPLEIFCECTSWCMSQLVENPNASLRCVNGIKHLHILLCLSLHVHTWIFLD